MLTLGQYIPTHASNTQKDQKVVISEEERIGMSRAEDPVANIRVRRRE